MKGLLYDPLAAIAAVAVLRDDGDDAGGGYEPQIREELLDQVRPSPGCPDGPRRTGAGSRRGRRQRGPRERRLPRLRQRGRGRGPGRRPPPRAASRGRRGGERARRDDEPAGSTFAGRSTTAPRYARDTLQPLGSAKPALPGPDQPSVLRGDTGRAVLVGHARDASASGPDELWLVDPFSGEPLDSHAEAGIVTVADVAVDATGDRVAYVGAPSEEECDGTARVDVDRVSALGGPVKAVVADVTFTESDLGSSTLAYRDGNWFIVE